MYRRGGVVNHGGDDHDGRAAHELRREVIGQTGRIHCGGDDSVEHYRPRGGETLWME